MRYTTHTTRPGGFTLTEVLIALAVLLIGVVTVASIFPVAFLLQKQTVDAIETRQVSRNAQAMLTGRKLTYTYDPVTATTGGLLGDATIGYHPSSTSTNDDVAPVPNLNSVWSLRDRSYPMESAQAADAKQYWVPLVRDANGDPTNPRWQVFAFILNRDDRATYPKPPLTAPAEWANPGDGDNVPGVRSYGATNVTSTGFDITLPAGVVAAAILEKGGWLVDNTGVIHRVAQVNGDTVTIEGLILDQTNLTHVWLSPKPSLDRPSAATRILFIENGVQTQ